MLRVTKDVMDRNVTQHVGVYVCSELLRMSWAKKCGMVWPWSKEVLHYCVQDGHANVFGCAGLVAYVHAAVTGLSQHFCADILQCRHEGL